MEREFNRLFEDISKLGEFFLRRDDKGTWTAQIKFPSPKGVTAEVHSGFFHKDPLTALQTLYDRIGGLQNMMTIHVPTIGIAHRVI